MVSRMMLCFVAASLASGTSPWAARQGGGARPPVRQVDHVMIRADDPREVFGFLTDTLRLPVAWPVETRGGVTSGGVGFGNVNVEAIRFPGQTDTPPRAHLVGFAFEPFSLADSLAELQRRGVGYGPPRPLVATGRDGTKQALFTNVTVRDLSDTDLPADAAVHIFLSEYSPAYVDVEERRARLHEELTAAKGGPLGVESVREIVIGASDIGAARARWQKMLDPIRPDPAGTWQVGSGPGIRVVSANQDRVQELVVRVASLARAKDFLRRNGLLASDSTTDATLDASKIFGVNIRLVD
jgi:hypothetical protein